MMLADDPNFVSHDAQLSKADRRLPIANPLCLGAKLGK